MTREQNFQPITVGIARTPDPLGSCAKLYGRAVEWLKSLGGVRVAETEKTLDSAETAKEICEEFASAGTDLTIILCCRLAGDAGIVEPFMRSSEELAVWCAPEPSRTGDLTLNSITCANLYMSAAKQLENACGGKRAKWLYGDTDDSLMANRLRVTIDALRAKKRLTGANIIRIGQTAPGFKNLFCSADGIRARYGTRISDVPLTDIFRRMEAVPETAAAKLAENMISGASRCCVSEALIDKNARLVLAVEALRDETGADAFAISCWPEFQRDAGFSVCLAFARLNETGTIVSCEGDVPGALTMLLAGEIAGSKPMIMDMAAMDVKNDMIQFWHCGLGMSCYADTEGTDLIKYPCDPRIMDHPGVSVNMKFAPGPVTICRLSGENAEKMLVCEANILEGPDRGYNGARGWVGDFTMDGDRASAPGFFNTVCGFGNPHHYIITAGRAENALREFASRLGLELAEYRQERDHLR